MAKTRGINSKFWSDSWVVDYLNPLDRYLFLYFLTNEHTNIAGVYELSITTLAFETGIEKETLNKAMIKRLEPKVFYVDGWVIIPNFPKHQNLKSEDVIKGITREFKMAPEHIQEEAVKRGWGDGLGMVLDHGGIAPGTKPNLTKLTSAIASREPIREEKEKPEAREKKPSKYPHSKEVFSWFPSPQKSWSINTTELQHAELLFERGEKQVRAALEFLDDHSEEEFCPQVTKPSDLERKWRDIVKFKNKNNL